MIWQGQTFTAMRMRMRMRVVVHSEVMRVVVMRRVMRWAERVVGRVSMHMLRGPIVPVIHRRVAAEAWIDRVRGFTEGPRVVVWRMRARRRVARVHRRGGRAIVR